MQVYSWEQASCSQIFWQAKSRSPGKTLYPIQRSYGEFSVLVIRWDLYRQAVGVLETESVSIMSSLEAQDRDLQFSALLSILNRKFCRLDSIAAVKFDNRCTTPHFLWACRLQQEAASAERERLNAKFGESGSAESQSSRFPSSPAPDVDFKSLLPSR